MIAEARAARLEYYRQYRQQNRERLNAYRRKWNRDNPDKIRKYHEDYWLRKAHQQSSDQEA